MNELEIIPFNGVGKIKLGMNQDDLRSVVGSSADNLPAHTNAGIEFPESDYFLESAIQVTYDPNTGLVDWIGFNDDIPFKLLFNSVDLFEDEVNEILVHTKKFGKLDENDSELGYSFNFPELGICYWRESKTEDLLNEFESADEDDKEWMLEDIEKSKHFQQVSIFSEGYWNE